MNTTIAVLISFTTFFAILFYFKVHKKIIKKLDDRADNIKSEIDEARQLREDAQSLLASFERRHTEVDTLAQEIISNAKTDSELYMQKAKKDLEQSVNNRVNAAKLQIQMAEKRAIKSVQLQAVNSAIEAVEKALKDKLSEGAIEDSVNKSFDKIKTQLH